MDQRVFSKPGYRPLGEKGISRKGQATKRASRKSMEEDSSLEVNRGFLLAVRAGNVHEVESFLEKGADPNYRGRGGSPRRDSALHIAMVMGHGGFDLIKRLLKCENLDVNCEDRDGNTALHLAFRELDYHYGGAALHLASTPKPPAGPGGCLEKIKELLRRADIDVNCKNRRGQTALHLAAQYGQLDAINELLKCEDIDVNCKDKDERTALHLAAQYWRYGWRYGWRSDVINELLKREDIDVNCRDKNEQTALHLAAQYGQLDAINELLKREDIDVNCKDKNEKTALHLAALLGQSDAINELLKREDIDVNCRDKNEQTALHLAALLGRPEVIKELLKREDIDINCTDNTKSTALHIALLVPCELTQLPLPNIINKLLERELISSGGGSTKLHNYISAASLPKYINIIKELLKREDINVDRKNNTESTVLHLGASHYANVLKDLLKREDIDVKIRGDYGRTALISDRRVDAAEELLRHGGVDVGRKDSAGRTALDVALPYVRNYVEQSLGDQARLMAGGRNIVSLTKTPGSSYRSDEQPLNPEVEHSSTSSATLSDHPTDRETSGSPRPSFTTLPGLDSTDEGEREDYYEDIDDFSNEDYEGQNAGCSNYVYGYMGVPHNLGDAGAYRHHGGNAGDAKGKGNSVSTNRKRLRDRPSSRDDEDDDNPPNKPSKRQKGEGIKGETTGNYKKPFACPYFKRSQYLCSQWKGRNVQEHLQLWCPRCKEFQTDNQTGMNRHLADDNCLHMAPGDDYLKNEVNTDIRDELSRYRPPKTCTWPGVYTILFHRDKPVIPDGFWYEAEARAAETFGNPSLRLSQCVPIPLDKQSEYQSGLAKTLANCLRLDEDYLKKRMIEFNTAWAASNSNQVQSPGIGNSETNPRDINNDAIASGIPSGIPQSTIPGQIHNPIALDISPLQCITTTATLNQEYSPSHPDVSFDGVPDFFDLWRMGTGEIHPATTPDDNHSQPVVRTTLEQGNDHLLNAQDPGPPVPVQPVGFGPGAVFMPRWS